MKFLQVIVLGVCLLTASMVSAQPNMEHVLHRVRAQYPAVWQAAHRDYGFQGQPGRTTKAQAELFVRIAAWEMNKEHAGTEHANSWGINGKRGVCSDLSQDVIQYRLGPNRNQGWDVIPGAGGPSPSIGWNAFPPSTDAEGCFVPGVEVTPAEISAIMAGGQPPPPPPPPPPATLSIADAAAKIIEAFQASHGRELEEVEIQAIAAYAQSRGWDGGNRMAVAVVEEIIVLLRRYSGDINNPFPEVIPAVVQQRINDQFLFQFGRYPRAVELDAINTQARLRGYTGGNMPEWLLDELQDLIEGYDGSYGAHLAQPVTQGAELSVLGPGFALDGERFNWNGQTAFLLFYDYTFNRGQYNRFRDAAAWNKVTVVRVSVATGTAYLQLQPRSGGTFGLGRTTPLYPGSIPNFWDHYRAMLVDLANHGILAEVVPFLTAGPPCNRGVCDFSVPQMHTEASRMAYLEETARELQSFRPVFVEIANEYNFIGFPDDGFEIVRLWQRYKQIDPLRLVALSAPAPPGSIETMAQGDYITDHISRDTSPYSFAWVLRQFGRPQLAFGKPYVNDEGINADTVGEFGADATPANHFINGATTQVLKMSYTFHYDRALKGLEPFTGDGSHQAYEAWRAGLDLVNFDFAGELFQGSPAGASPNFPFSSLGGAVAVAGRINPSEGIAIFYGVPGNFTLPLAQGWTVDLIADVGLHRVYRLSR